MTQKEMLDCLLSVWENMTVDKDRETYKEMLMLLDNMCNYLRYDLQCDYTIPPQEIKAGEFIF